MPRCNLSTIILLLCLSQAIGCVPLHAQDPCDTLLHADNLGPLGYGNRGDRCEGLYMQPVGSTAIWLVSLTQNFEGFDASKQTPLLVSWASAPGAGPVHLRAVGIRRKLYYRMDAISKAGGSVFTWKTNLLSSLGIGQADLGILGSTSVAFAGSEKEVYLPLRIGQHDQPAAPGQLHLLIMPGVELSEVYLSLAPAKPDGRPGAFINNGTKLGYGYYPAERAIDIPLTGMRTKGMYYEQISATLKTGGTTSIEILFYYTGE